MTGRGVRVLTVGAAGAVLVGLAGAVLIDQAQIQSLQRQVVTLRATAASPARITITRLQPDSPHIICETVLNESGRPLEVRTEVEGTPPDPSRVDVAPRDSTVWCVQDR